MKSPRLFFLAACLAAAGLARAEDPAEVKPVALVSTPAAVQTTVLRLVGKGTLMEVQPVKENGETSYEVSFTKKDGTERDFTVADDGTLLSRKAELAELPESVQKTIHDRAAGWTLEEIDENMTEMDRSYDVDVSKDGAEKYFTISLTGELLSKSVALAETPVAVQATVTNEVGAWTVESIDEVFDADGNSFDVAAVGKKGGRKSFSVAPDGGILSREVKLGWLPPEVRRTVNLQIDTGKIIRIDKQLKENVQGVKPFFYVTGRKEGLPYNFMVGPGGRFLGMDE